MAPRTRSALFGALLAAMLVPILAAGTGAADAPAIVPDPDHGLASTNVDATYTWVGCGPIPANFYTVDLYWDTTDASGLVGSSAEFSYPGKGDCVESIPFTVPAADPGGHALIAQIRDGKGNVQSASVAKAGFIVDAPASPKPTLKPTPKPTANPVPTATAQPKPSAAQTSGPATAAPATSPASPAVTESVQPTPTGSGVNPSPPPPSDGAIGSKAPGSSPTDAPAGSVVGTSLPTGPLITIAILLIGLVIITTLWWKRPERGGRSDRGKPGGKQPGGPGEKQPDPPDGKQPGGPGGKQPGAPGDDGGFIPPRLPGPAPVPIPTLIPTREREPARNGCDFTLASWTVEGTAFDAIEGDTVPGAAVRINGRPLVPLGGDYWHLPYRRGNRDGQWFGSPFGDDRDRATGSRTSREFQVDFNYLSFLVAGSEDPDRLRVELLMRAAPPAIAPGVSLGTVTKVVAPATVVRSETGAGTDRFRQVVWDVREFAGRVGAVRLVDASEDGHLDVADLACSMQRPDPFVPPIWGWADIHAHPMANIGFGGKLIYGGTGGSLADLGHCESSHGVGGTFFGSSALLTLLPFLDAAVPEQGAVSGGVGHLTGGYPEFDGWPRHSSTIHQTMHWDWVRRAFDGGQRLLVALVVNAEALAEMFPGPHPAGDDATITEQIRIWTATIPDWAEVALTPADARRIIGEDRLAIVLGLEVDRALGLWGNWDELNLAPEAARPVIRQRIEVLRSLGIRQLNPIHLADNVFGGSAVYKDDFNVTQYKLHHSFLQVEGQPAAHAPDEQIDFRLNATFGDWFTQLTTTGVLNTAGESPTFPDYGRVAPGVGHRNRAGLTPIGVVAMEELQAAGMIIDIDHMSERSTHDALSHLVPADYPVVSGHATFRATAPRRRWGEEEHPRNGGEPPHSYAPRERADVEYWPHESEKTAAVLAQIAALRGVIAPITGGMADRLTDPSHRIANDSSGSSKTWAQEFLYARRGMGDRGIALGSDAVALLAQPGARFGPQASWGLKVEPGSVGERRWQSDRQTNGVSYAEPIRDYRAHRFAGTDVYDMEERDIWEATAIVKAGLNPWRPDQQPDGPGAFNRTAMVQNKINNIAKGLLATSESQLENPILFGGDTHAEQRAAFLVAQNPLSASPITHDIPTLPESEPQRVRELFPRIWRIWQMWARMEWQMPGVPNNEPLARSIAGRRDFDINIDGVAHYGMFTDFLQDLRNVGLGEGDLSVIMRSAEDYIEVWERCEAARTRASSPFQVPDAIAGLTPPSVGG